MGILLVGLIVDALGRRIGKTVDGTTTFFLPAGAQTVVEIDRPALPPSQAAIDGAEADGALASLAEAPASGGILPGAAGTVTRINFQPSTTATPAGFIRDTGKATGVRTNGLTYGWSTDTTAQAVVRGGAVPLVEFDTFIQTQTDASSASWSIALPNGTYPVVVVAGDALSTEQTNHLVIGGVFREDLTPSVLPGYQAGNFDGYALEVTVTDGTLTIAPGNGAYHAKLCFVEIGAAGTPGTLITPEITATLVARIAQANAQTGANPIVRNGQREYIYGSYIDEAVAFVQTVGDVSQRYYPHNNHLYSVAAVTNAAGQVVERYTYTAYGAQTINAPGGAVRATSAVGFDRGFTGSIVDRETLTCYLRSRSFSPSLGIFTSRDGMIDDFQASILGLDLVSPYLDGMSSYRSWFIPNMVDPTGQSLCTCIISDPATVIFGAVPYLPCAKELAGMLITIPLKGTCVGKLITWPASWIVPPSVPCIGGMTIPPPFFPFCHGRPCNGYLRSVCKWVPAPPHPRVKAPRGRLIGKYRWVLVDSWTEPCP